MINGSYPNNMIKLSSLLLGGAAAVLFSSMAGAQSFLGRPYAAFELGHERRETKLDTYDGVLLGATVNAPVHLRRPQDPGLDLHLAGNLALLAEDEFELREWRYEALLRGYLPLGLAFTAYGATGWSGISTRIEQELISFTERGSYLPVELGAQIRLGQLSLVPFARYSVALERGFDDYWAAGGTLAYWFSQRWAVTAKVTHTDFDHHQTRLSSTLGFVYSY